MLQCHSVLFCFLKKSYICIKKALEVIPKPMLKTSGLPHFYLVPPLLSEFAMCYVKLKQFVPVNTTTEMLIVYHL